MEYTLFSCITSVIWVSIFATAASFLRKHMNFLKYFSIYPLLFILFISFIRLFFSFELSFAKVIPSVTFLPSLLLALSHPFIQLVDGRFNVTLFMVLLCLWCTIAIARLSFKIQRYRHLRCLLRFLPACEDKRLQDILSKVQSMGPFKKQVKVIVHREIKSPAIVGLYSTVIMMPDLFFTDDELLGIFIHEWAHYCYGHAVIKGVGEILQCIFWWNPVFKMLNIEIAHALEMHSDKIVNKLLSKKQKHSYLKAIVKVTDSLGKNEKSSMLTCNLIEKKEHGMLCQRFKMIMGNCHSTHNKSKFFLVTIPICVTFVLSYLFVIQPHILPDISQYGEMVYIPDDAYIVETKDGYILHDSDGEFIADIVIISDDLKHLKIIK